MTAAAQRDSQNSTISNSNTDFPSDTYDPDDCVPRNSPLMKALRPNLRPSPTPPPEIPQAQVSATTFSKDDRSSNTLKIRTHDSEDFLINCLNNGQHSNMAHNAGRQPFSEDTDYYPGDSVDQTSTMSAESREGRGQQMGLEFKDLGAALSPVTSNESHGRGPLSATSPTSTSSAAGGNLQHFAVGALQAVVTEPPPKPPSQLPYDLAVGTRHLSIHDDKALLPGPLALRDPSRSRTEANPRRASSPGISASATGELPPIQIVDSPRPEFKGQNLPSIRAQLGDLSHLSSDSQTVNEKELSPTQVPIHPRPVPTNLPRLSSITGVPTSPPISPNDAFQRNLPSPHSLTGATPPYYYPGSGPHRRPTLDYSSSTTAETPSTDQNPLTPHTIASVTDRMSIDGITNPQGGYVCPAPGCNASPFQTQYLLNSHANVHSSARPHYCPVPGCPRGEPGRGFKRKNEMIRHGLVHDSPGYVCPFCAEREHKYPRPDNLQRYARVLDLISEEKLTLSGMYVFTTERRRWTTRRCEMFLLSAPTAQIEGGGGGALGCKAYAGVLYRTAVKIMDALIQYGKVGVSNHNYGKARYGVGWRLACMV